jgi:ribosome biogenesis ATPase
VRSLFLDAAAAAPSIVFIDEIDAITPKRESGARGMELRIVAQLLTCMDGVGQAADGVLVLGATNRPDALDPALRRAGRFDREICLGIPDEPAREHVLRVLVAKVCVCVYWLAGKARSFQPALTPPPHCPEDAHLRGL